VGAHLVDAVLPWVPVRQWVLTVPYRLRYQMAWNHRLSRAVLRGYTRVLLDVCAGGARARGTDGGQTGMVTALQRAGSALNTNLHFHRRRVRSSAQRSGRNPSGSSNQRGFRWTTHGGTMMMMPGAIEWPATWLRRTA
jgi:hypothetical protein